jgi:hypothetical protein
MVKVVVLNRIPEPFESASELGIEVEGVLASVIASYIFYLLVIHLQEWREQEVIGPYLQKHARSIYGSCQLALNEIGKTVGVTLELETVTLAAIQQAFAQIAPMSNAPLVLGQAGTPANWPQFFEYHMARGKVGIGRVLDQLRFLDPKLVRLVVGIDDSPHYSFITAMRGIVPGNPNLSVWADPFFRFCESCRDLKVYLDRRFGSAS